MSSISAESPAMAGKKRAQVLAEIRQLEQAGDTRRLHHYLTQLASYGDRPRQYENLFARYLTAPAATLREAAVRCLLVALRSPQPAYRAAALAMATDPQADFDLRLWASSGLALAYQGTKAPDLLAAFLAVIDDEAADPYLQSSFIRSVVLLLGVPSHEQWLRAQSDSAAALRTEFAPELAAARTLARGR